ncbi:MAG: hypothetical protein KAI17_16905, partial [Thiotrichaceae bacterium]|nr:hypothetical protein [Thiotrichaceae bacterium]
VLALFKHFTVHRGTFHSLLGATSFSLFTVCITHYIFNHSIYFSWISGIFIGLGFITHLLLDEFYSVDLGNVQLKRSFGTALKLFSLLYLRESFAMMIFCALIYFYTPAFPFPISWKL